MRTIFASLVSVIFATAALSAAESPDGSNLGSVKGGSFSSAQTIIARKCVRCHSSDTIDAALSAKKNLPKIQLQMEERGAGLNADEREVLGIYWKQQTPLKQKP